MSLHNHFYKLIILFLLFFVYTPLFTNDFLEIIETNKSFDENFRIHQDHLDEASQLIYSQLSRTMTEDDRSLLASQLNSLFTFFNYQSHLDETLITIAANFGLPIETISTANQIESPELFTPGSVLKIPNMNGIFIPYDPINSMESKLLEENRTGKIFFNVEFSNNNIIYKYKFYPGEYFNRSERGHFFKAIFLFPLPMGRVTSSYGNRIHPITAKPDFHHGIDWGVETGTPVFASRNGAIKNVGILENYGIYIIIEHEGGFETVYSHLDHSYVNIGDVVMQGDIIAASGNTGISTGPHLHFEIRKDGESLNPVNYLGRGF